MKRLAVLVLSSLLLVVWSSPGDAATLPAVKHVFVILLENKGFDQTFGPSSPAQYLAHDLPAQGQLLEQYYGIGHLSLPNYVALVSGQAPNPVTQSDCITYVDMLPGVIGPDGQAIGQGCVYPAAVITVADQLEAHGLSWKGYMEDMATPCRHPTLNSVDQTQSAKVGDQYASRHDPFMYFHSIIDEPTCASNVVPFDQLSADLASASTTPNLSFITPNLCHDGHDAPCVDGEPGGLASEDAFLSATVPTILDSPAYKDGGLLIVTYDEAEYSAQSGGDDTACCGEQSGPNTPSAGQQGPGGGRVGAVVISPFVTAGTRNATPYNHYSLLRTVEDLFGLDHLGYAGAAGVSSFGSDVFGTGAPGSGSNAAASGRSLANTGSRSDIALPIALLALTVACRFLLSNEAKSGATKEADSGFWTQET